MADKLQAGKNSKHNIAETGTDPSGGGTVGGERCTCDTPNWIWEKFNLSSV